MISEWRTCSACGPVGTDDCEEEFYTKFLRKFCIKFMKIQNRLKKFKENLLKILDKFSYNL